MSGIKGVKGSCRGRPRGDSSDGPVGTLSGKLQKDKAKEKDEEDRVNN